MTLSNRFTILIPFLALLPAQYSYAQILTTDTLQQWGYLSSSKSHYLRDYCASTTPPIITELQHVKSLKMSREINDAYYRFTFGEETFESELFAQQRVNEINSPHQRNSKQSKMCDIRKAFNLKSTVYFIHTDVDAFRAELERLFELLVRSNLDRINQ